ncbi:MAG: C25 family cysteine peptidase [Saprospiraceae bacterium]
MKLKNLYFIFLLLLCAQQQYAQMTIGSQVLYGNEWINYNQNYCKIQVAADGIYRLTGAELKKSGVPIASIPANHYKIFYLGQEIPFYCNAAAEINETDYIEFFGRKNRSEIDVHLYKNPAADLMNPKYSLFNDTSAYFLTWSADISKQRFEETNNELNNLPAKEDFFMHSQDTVFSDGFDKKFNQLVQGDELKSSQFVTAEGFASDYSNNTNVALSPQDHFTNGLNAKLSVFVGWRDLNKKNSQVPNRHKTIISVNSTQYLRDSSFAGRDFGIRNLETSIPASEIKPNMIINIRSTGNSSDDHRIAYITLTYPRTFQFGHKNNFIFTISGSATKKYIQIENIQAGLQPVIYDLSNQLRIKGKVSGSVAEFALPASAQDRQLVYYLENKPVFCKIKKNIVFSNYSQKKGNYLIVSHKRFFTDKNNSNQVQEYADYRNSVSGGAYQSTIVDIEEVYDQFAYGIDRHNIAVRNFSNFAVKNWNPKFLFLIGRGITYDECRKPLDESQSEAYTVPTFGYPGADHLLSGSNNSNAFGLATGRIPVINANEISAFLDKIKTFERIQRDAAQTVAERQWMKRIVNISGGDINIQNIAERELEMMGRALELNKFGGKVFTFKKTSDAPVSVANSEELRNHLNNGVAMVNFFGHSATSNIDYAIDPSYKMENKDRYFFFASYGCYSGLAHGVGKAFGTTYVLEKGKGAIAYLSPGQYGTTAALPEFGQQFYYLLGTSYYGKSVGETIQETVRQLDQFGVYSKELLNHMTFQGDPAMRLNTNPGPDYVIEPSSVSIEPKLLTTAQNTFTLQVKLSNIGSGTYDTLALQITRKYPDGKKRVIYIDSSLLNIRYENKLTFTLPIEDNKSAGLNTFYITIDPKNKIKELPVPAAENNNELYINGQQGFSTFIISSDLNLVYPPRYGIVSTSKIALNATTSNAFAKKQKYFIEIDTSQLFNSSFKKKTTIEQKGGLITWQPDFDLTDSTVYYWRATPDSLTPAGYVWRTSSFIYLKNSESGWNQSHYYQFKDNTYQFIELEDNRRFDYSSTISTLGMQNFAYDFPNNPNLPGGIINSKVWNVENFKVPFINGYYLSETNTGVVVIVVEPKNLEPWLNKHPGLYGSDHTQNQWEEFWFPYATNTAGNRAKLINFLENVVPVNHYVAIMTVQQKKGDISYFADRWAADSLSSVTNNISIFKVLEKQGAKKVRSLANGSVPYIFMYKKDDPTFKPIEEKADSANQQSIAAEINMKINWINGKVNTKNIGPASSWSKVFWKTAEIEGNDQTLLSIYGNTKKGKDTLLFKNISAPATDISGIDAKTFPNLKLEWFSADTTNRTAPQLKYWRVTHKGVPEAVLTPNQNFSFFADTLVMGQTLKLSFAARNISDYKMDSLLIMYKIKSENNTAFTRYQRVKPLLANDSLNTSFSFDTKTISGNQELSIRINPRNDQAEFDTTNNFGVLNFYVKKDQQQPLIDVLVDGNHIINGDLVSAKPTINITVKDENKYLFMQDTSLFQIYLRYPEEASARRIAFHDPMVKFFPGNSSNRNRASIEINPVFEIDGDYQLLVKARDVSGNKTVDYQLKDLDVGNPDFYNFKLAFKVITKKSISNVLNYPNPFTSSTQFVYTLTGNEAPFYFKIQILTISGMVVRELTQAELGPLKIGTHRTEYAWNGTDQYGDPLAAGVYLYKVIAKKANGEDFELNTSSSDSYFKNGIGKLVILR